MKKRDKITIVYLVVLLAVLLISVLYILNFHNASISYESSDWGTFGDYFGGILNPIIGIANIFVFIHLTRTIADIDDKNNERAINTQKELFKLELKHNAYYEVANLLAKLPEAMMHEEPIVSLKNMTMYNNQFFNIVENNSFLFPVLDKDNTRAIFQLISDLQANIDLVVRETDEIKKKEMFIEISRTFDYTEFLNQKAILLEKLQQNLIN